MRRTRAVLSVAASVLLLSACSSGDSGGGSSGGAGGAPVKIGTVNFPTSLDPTVSSSGYDYPHLNLIYDRLLVGDPKTGELGPGLASAWKVADDGSSITLTLRDGVKFSDGTALDAAAVKASLERFKASANGKDIASVATITAEGTNSVVLAMSKADSSIPTALSDRAGMIVSPTAAQKEGKDFAARPVGAGKYTLESLQTGAAVNYKRNDAYWGDKGAAPTLNWQVFKDPQAMVTAFQSNVVDVAVSVPPLSVDKLKSVAGKQVVVGPAYSETMINFNAKLAPTDRVEIRQAINYALDREVVRKAASGDAAEVTWTALPPTHPYYDASIAPTYPYDEAKAKALVAQATGGQRVAMKCLTFPGLNYETSGPIIIDALKKIGIDVTIQSETAAAATEAFWAKDGAPCFLSGWTGHADPAITYGRLLNPDSFYNAGKTDFGTAALQDKLLTTFDFAQRKAAATEVAKKVAEVAPFAPLFTVPMIVGVSDQVSGYQPNASGRPDMSTVAHK
jgi:ABC-type transport system substrate-binding protein